MPLSWCSWTTATASRRPPSRFAAVLATALLAACQPHAGPSGGSSANGLPHDALDDAVARAIGDPTTCLLLADRVSGRIVYQYGAGSTCARELPACDRTDAFDASDSLAVVLHGGERHASCQSAPGRQVGWAAGPVPGPRGLVYSAVMEGERALPGIEMQARLADAFVNAGITTGPPSAATNAAQ